MRGGGLLVLCCRGLVDIEGVAAPADQGAARSNSRAIATSRNVDMWDAAATEWQQTSTTQHQRLRSALVTMPPEGRSHERLVIAATRTRTVCPMRTS